MIQAINLTKSFGAGTKEVKAIDHISFEVAEGQLFTLLGPSGCGKTTTLRCIAGLESPSQGEITIGNQVVFSDSKGILVPANKRSIGMVFQSYAIWPHMTVFQNLAYPLRGQGYSRKETRERALRTLETVGLLGLEDRPAPNLSGGQQQRVALARAIAGSPRILLLDEPLSNLDAKLREEMRSEIRQLQRRLKITSIYVTHDQVEALTISDQIAVMEAGKIIEVGSPADIYLRPKSRFAANFIGLTNVIPGRKKAALAGDKMIVETAIGEIRCMVNDDLNQQKRLLILVRPESLRVSRTLPDAAENVWSGKVKEKTFVGDFVDCQISCNDFLLRAKLDSYTDLAAGDSVYVSVDPVRCTTIPEGT